MATTSSTPSSTGPSWSDFMDIAKQGTPQLFERARQVGRGSKRPRAAITPKALEAAWRECAEEIKRMEAEGRQEDAAALRQELRWFSGFLKSIGTYLDLAKTVRDDESAKAEPKEKASLPEGAHRRRALIKGYRRHFARRRISDATNRGREAGSAQCTAHAGARGRSESHGSGHSSSRQSSQSVADGDGSGGSEPPPGGPRRHRSGDLRPLAEIIPLALAAIIEAEAR